MSVTFSGLGLRLWVTPDDFATTADFYGSDRPSRQNQGQLVDR